MSDAAIAYYDDSGTAIFRASAVNKCSKALVLSLLGYDAVGPGEKMQAIFDAGHRFEPELLAHVAGMGYQLYGQQSEYEIPLGGNAKIRMHPDALGSHPEHGMALIEAKTMAPKPYEAWLKHRFAASDLTRHYADQVSVMWEAIRPAVLVMVVGRKEKFIRCANCNASLPGHTTYHDAPPEGVDVPCQTFIPGEEDIRIDAIDVVLFFEPPANVGKIKARLAKVLNVAKTGVVPEQCDKDDYPCGFFQMHTDKMHDAPELTDGEGQAPGYIDDLTDALSAYVSAQQVEAAAKKDKTAAKTVIVGLLGAETPGAAGGYAVDYIPTERTFIDESKLVAAGLVPDDFKTTAPGAPRISVKEIA